MGLFDGKKGLVFGIANDHSIAWAITTTRSSAMAAASSRAASDPQQSSRAGPARPCGSRELARELRESFLRSLVSST